MKKRLISVLLCTAMAAVLAAGCGSDAGSGGDTGSGNGDEKGEAFMYL